MALYRRIINAFKWRISSRKMFERKTYKKNIILNTRTTTYRFEKFLFFVKQISRMLSYFSKLLQKQKIIKRFRVFFLPIKNGRFKFLFENYVDLRI